MSRGGHGDVPRAEALSSRDRLRELKVLREGSREDLRAFPVSKAGEGAWAKAWSDRARGNDVILKEGRFRLDIRKFFHERMVRSWYWLAREAVAAPLLEVSGGSLDRSRSSLVR